MEGRLLDDFLFLREPQSFGRLAGVLAELPPVASGRETMEFHGAWGSLAVSTGVYPGLAPVETSTHLCAVLGGPVLMFDPGTGCSGQDATVKTRAILRRWLDDRLVWDVDLAGPFIVLIVDKATNDVSLYTDLLLFTPCYISETPSTFGAGSHVDLLARALGVLDSPDPVSIADFVMHGVVTHPHTVYNGIVQADPAAEVVVTHNDAGLDHVTSRSYWQPTESDSYSTLGSAAVDIREGFQEYVWWATRGMSKLAYLASGGEDSRVVASALPKHVERHGFVFVNAANREAAIARTVASRLDAAFHLVERGSSYYLENFNAMARLTGGGVENVNVHFLGLAERAGLPDFDGVFGGYFADSILKGAAQSKVFPSWLQFLPELPSRRSRDVWNVESRVVPEVLSSLVVARRRAHHARVKQLRPQSADEWFSIWPASMRQGNSNIAGARRLFRDYEPFTSPRVVKAAAAVPSTWKLNRRLFHRAFKDNLADVGPTPHSDGRLPHLPWWINSFILLPYFTVRAIKRIAASAGLRRVYDGPWADWVAISQSDALYRLAEPHAATYEAYFSGYGLGSLKEALSRGSSLSVFQRIHLVQALFSLNLPRKDG